jgi:glyoxylase-like metal-dependent hydrolase (beta-lactamase superfamily II)
LAALTATRSYFACAQQPLRGPCDEYVLGPLKFLLSLVAFLVVIVYLLCTSILSGLGMLGMSQVMPSFMRLVYPSPLGRIHTMVLGLYRQCFMPEEGHSRSIRIDLVHKEENGGGLLGADYVGGGAPAPAAALRDEPAAPVSPAADPEEPPLDESPPVRPTKPVRPYSVHTVACLADNYAYVLVDVSVASAQSHRVADDAHPAAIHTAAAIGRVAAGTSAPLAVALVDPAEPAVVERALAALSRDEYAGRTLEPVAILTTHRHWDHAAGNRALKKAYPRIRVYGGVDDHVSGCTHPLRDGDTLRVGSLTVRALHAPCHTRGSLCYVVDGPTPSLFGGDTLFCGGCGAPFEGTTTEMGQNFTKYEPSPRHCSPRHTSSRSHLAHTYPQRTSPRHTSPTLLSRSRQHAPHRHVAPTRTGPCARHPSRVGRIWRRCASNTLVFTGHEYTSAILPSYLSGSSQLPNHPAAYGKVRPTPSLSTPRPADPTSRCPNPAPDLDPDPGPDPDPGLRLTLTLTSPSPSPSPDTVASVASVQVCSLLWRANQLRSLHPPAPTTPLVLADELLINTNFARYDLT